MPSVPAPHKLAHAIASDTLTETAEEQLYQAFPKLSGELHRIIEKRFGPDEILATQPQQTFTTPLTEDEVFAIFRKLYEISQLPGLSFDKETELYLEQQLADVLGFEVTTISKGFKLPFIKGTIDSLPHLYSTPTQSGTRHNLVHEAGIAKHRSVFGWQLPGNSKDASTVYSPYWVSLPLRAFVSSEHSFSEVKKWAYKKKLLLINPSEAFYCVAELLDDYYDPAGRHQLGGSPAVIRNGLFWSPANLGKVIIFFVNDPGNIIRPGSYQLLG